MGRDLPGREQMSVSPLSDVLPTGTMVGDYRVEGKIGEGGMSTVYAAVHPLIGKRAAIKILSRALGENEVVVQRFIEEARAVNRVGHPNIVDIFSIGRLDDGRAYLVMEWLKGESLGDRIARGPLPLEAALDVLEQLCPALHEAHQAGIVHRDLKPDNVFLVAVPGSERPLVKLLDFGIAKLRTPQGTASGSFRTQTGMTMGTPAYVSPEQARAKDVDRRADVYSLGVIAFEMVLGRLPFDADSVLDLMMHHVQTPPPSPRSLWPDMPPVLDALLLAMLAKDPDERPSLPEVLETIRHLRGGSSPSRPAFRISALPLAPAPAVSEPAIAAPPPRRRGAWVPVLALLLGIGAVGAAIAVVMTHRSPRPAALPDAAIPAPVMAPVEAPAPPATVVDAAVPAPAPAAPVPDAGPVPEPGPKRPTRKKKHRTSPRDPVPAPREQPAPREPAPPASDNYTLDPFGRKKR